MSDGGGVVFRSKGNPFGPSTVPANGREEEAGEGVWPILGSGLGT